MMFDMDENLEEKQTRERARSTASRSSGNSNSNSHGSNKKKHDTVVSLGTSLSSVKSGGLTDMSRSIDSDRSSRSGTGFLRWRSGFCNKAARKNEDRFVNLPQLSDNIHLGVRRYNSGVEVEEAKGPLSQDQHHHHNNKDKPLARASSTTANNDAHGGVKENSCGYFAVYDGHCGVHAANFLEEILHDRISRHSSFLSATEEAVIETCIAVDKEFLVIQRT